MRKQIGLFFLFLNAFNLLAQHYDAGIRVNSMQLNNVENYGISLGAKHDNGTRSYIADVLIERINFNTILLRTKAGFKKDSYTSNATYNYSNNNSFRDTKETFSEYFFSLGIGRYYDLEKVSFKLGVEIPVHFRGIRYKIFNNVSYDTTGKKLGSKTIIYEYPAILLIGAFFFANVYYNFWKSFSVGIEVSNGFLYITGKGPASEVQETYDANGNLTDKKITEGITKYRGFNASFLNPSVGLSYRF